jgi:hypothetical protein
MARVKVAELTSGLGALVLGMGLGALFAKWLAAASVSVVLAGLIAHAFGMWDKHRLDGQNGADGGALVTALYWVCWLLLGGVLVFVLVSH